MKTELATVHNNWIVKLSEIKTTSERQDACENKLKVKEEGEGIGKENERDKLLNFNNTKTVNMNSIPKKALDYAH